VAYPTQVSIDTAQVSQLLAQLQHKCANPQPVLHEIGEILLFSVQRNFDVGGRPAWPKLAKSTIAQRVKAKKWPGKILQRSGAYGLLGSVNKRVGKDFVAIGTNKVYAATHQFGAKKGQFGKLTVHVKSYTKKISKPGKKKKSTVTVKAHSKQMLCPWGNIPARPFLAVQDEDLADINETIGNYLAGNK